MAGLIFLWQQGGAAHLDRTPDSFGRLKRRYYRQLQEELDRQLEAEAEAIRAREDQEPQPKRKRRRKRKAASETPIALAGEQPNRVQTEVVKILANQPVISTDARARRKALEAHLDAVAQHLAMQDEEDAIFMLLMG